MERAQIHIPKIRRLVRAYLVLCRVLSALACLFVFSSQVLGSFPDLLYMVYKHFNNNIGSNVAFHGIAPQVWAAFEKMLFKKEGKKVHFKKKGDIHS